MGHLAVAGLGAANIKAEATTQSRFSLELRGIALGGSYHFRVPFGMTAALAR